MGCRRTRQYPGYDSGERELKEVRRSTENSFKGLVQHFRRGSRVCREGVLVRVLVGEIQLFQNLSGVFRTEGFHYTPRRHNGIFREADNPDTVLSLFKELFPVILHDYGANHGFERFFHEIFLVKHG